MIMLDREVASVAISVAKLSDEYGAGCRGCRYELVLRVSRVFFTSPHGTSTQGSVGDLCMCGLWIIRRRAQMDKSLTRSSFPMIVRVR